MLVKHPCGIVLLVLVCVSAGQEISISESDDVRIKSEIETIVHNVFHKPGQCASDADCHHLGKCITRDGGKFCNCKNGTSGDFCETVDECVDNPERCGTQNDVSCIFDVVDEKADCKCDNDSKTYVIDEERCMNCDCGSDGAKCEFKDGSKVCTCKEGYIKSRWDGSCTQVCNATNPCENGGKCVGNVCSCLKGTSGNLCKTVGACRGIAKCGEADCFYNATSQEAYCKCRNTRLALDDLTKRCNVCDCGTYQRSCSFVQGIKKCNCMDAYEDKRGECTLCFCKGYSSMYGCHFDNWNMVCNCLKGYAQQGDECKKCNCGNNGVRRCDFENGKKVCSCENGYTEYQGTCEACFCGYIGECQFNRFGNKKCTCPSGYGTKNGVCTDCNCYPGTSCIFEGGNGKVCICPKKYANDKGSCADCDCRLEEANCTLNYGMTKCQCPKGYEEARERFDFYKSYCKEIDECLKYRTCPSTTNCVNTPGSYDCVCKEGYEKPASDTDTTKVGCVDIDECVRNWSPCNDPYARCVNTPGSYRCDCREGFSVSKGYIEKRNSCLQDSRPWRTATIVVGCLSAVVIIGLLIGIFNRHRS